MQLRYWKISSQLGGGGGTTLKYQDVNKMSHPQVSKTYQAHNFKLL